MKKIISLISILLLTVGANASTVSKNFSVKGKIKTIETSCGIDVDYVQGDAVAVTAFADSKDINDVEITLRNGVLHIGIDNSFSLFGSHKDVKVKITAPEVSGFSTSGGADIDINSDLNLPGKLNISTSGGADVTFKRAVKAGSVDISTSGGADVDFDGSLICASLNVSASGGADIEIKSISTGTANVSASGGSDIKISGTAETVNLNASGAATVKARHLTAKRGTARATGSSDIYCDVESLSASSSGTSDIKNYN